MVRDSFREVKQPWEALLKLQECLVLGFVYEESQHRFALVADFPDDVRESDRAFVAFRFFGVRDFVRERGDLSWYEDVVDSYTSADYEASVVIQHVSSSKELGRRSVELWFGPNFGGIRFSCDELKVTVRYAYASEIDGSWIYRDAESREEFDFYTPFPDIAVPPEIDRG